MSEEIEKVISGDKRYVFPPQIEEIHYAGKWIVVSPLTANWIVLENYNQLAFFHLLYDYNLEEAIANSDAPEEDIQWVIIQLEARRFESLRTHLKQNYSSVHFYLTNACNMRCPHCYMSAGQPLEQELLPEDILNAIDALAEGGVESIVFSGGEPLLNNNFRDYVKRAHSVGMSVEVLSNGTLWTDELIDELASSLASVQISIDGFDEKSNSSIRGVSNFKKALNTVEKLIGHGIHTSIAMVPQWSNKLESKIPDYVRFAKNLIERYDDKLFDFSIVGEVWDGRNLKLSNEEKLQFKRIVSKIFREIYGDNSEDAPFVSYHKGGGIEENCAYGNLSIAANGDVYLCAQIQPLNPIGNIRTHSIEELLNISKEAKERSEISNLKPCSDCAIRYICGGDCRIKNFTYLNSGMIPKDNQMPERECAREYKESMYDLMIRTNQQIFQ